MLVFVTKMYTVYGVDDTFYRNEVLRAVVARLSPSRSHHDDASRTSRLGAL